VNFKVMLIVMQRSPPTLGLKIASHNWRKTNQKKKKKKGKKQINLQMKPSVQSLSREVVVGQGRSEEECPERGRRKQ